jgi:hypothetical protein
MRTRLLGLSIMAAMIAALLTLAGVAGATSSDKDEEVTQGAAQRVGPAVTEREITSDGPITRINIDNELQNDVDYKDVEQTYPDESATHLAVDDTTYGARGDISFTPVSQERVTGSGTQKNPFEIVTKVAAGDTGLTLTQTDTYVEGKRWYQTNIKVSNEGAEAVEAILYRYVDCEVGVPEQDDPGGGIDDGGFGNAYPKTGSAACLEAVGQEEPGNNLLGLRPLSKGSRYQQGERRSLSETDGVIEKVEQQRSFSNTVDKDYVDDTAVVLSWRISVPAGGSVTASSIMGFTENTLTNT